MRRARAGSFSAGVATWWWIDPNNDALVVARWLDEVHSAGFVRFDVRALGR